MSESSPTRPNFLFLFPDQHRWDWLGLLGRVPVRTPNLDRLAQRGMRFNQCRTNSPLCAPARAALASGLRPSRNGVTNNGMSLPPGQPTFFRDLRDAGYRVLASGKTDLSKHGGTKTLDGRTPEVLALGFTDIINQCGKWDAVNTGWPTPSDPYMAYLHEQTLAETHVLDYQRRNKMRRDADHPVLDTAASPLPREACTDDFTGRQALRLLDEAPADEPWLLWVNFPGPHEPFDPPAELRERYDGVDFPPPIDGERGQAQDHPQLRRNYAAMIEGIDEWCGRLIAAVEARGELENTIIIYSSDHGEMLGDHGQWYKSVPYEASVHVPLIVAGPGVRQGETSAALVELIDIGATIADLAGVPASEAVPDRDARSFAGVLHGQAKDAEHRAVQSSELHDWRMVTDGRWKLVVSGGGATGAEAVRLYDLHADPNEQRSLVADHPQEVERLREHLEMADVG